MTVSTCWPKPWDRFYCIDANVTLEIRKVFEGMVRSLNGSMAD